MKRMVSLLLYAMVAISLAVARHENESYRAGSVFRLIDTTNGLPDNELKTLFRVPDGRLGIRTSSSLSLFDGCEFRSFPPSAPKAHPMDYIAALPIAYVDGRQRVWLKETGHLFVFDLTTESYIDKVGALLRSMGVKESICDIFIDSAKDYWIVTADGKMLRVHGESSGTLKDNCQRVNIRTAGLRDVCRMGNQVWFIYNNGLLRGLNLHTKEIFAVQKLWQGSVPTRDFIRFSQAGNRLWLMWNHGVATYLPTTRKWRCCHRDNNSAFVSICATPQGIAYVGIRQKGLAMLTANGELSLQHSFPTTDGKNITDDVETIAYLNGSLFLGLYTKGMCFHSPNMQSFVFYRFHNLGIGMSGYRIDDRKDGNVCFSGTNGIFIFDLDKRTFTPFAPHIDGSDFIRCFEDSKGRCWIGTFRHGLYMIDGVTAKHFMQGEIPSQDINYNIVRGFAEDRQHRIWVNYHGGIGWFDEHAGRIVPLQSKLFNEHKVVNDLSVDKDNRLWFATGTGLLVYSIHQNKVYSPHDLVRDREAELKLGGACKTLLIDSHGLVWVGTLNGLYLINPRKKAVRSYGKHNGMPNEMIQGVIEDVYGHIWVTTANGLCRFQRALEEKFNLTVFDSQNKLNDGKFGWMTIGHVAGSKLLFGCNDGFYIVDPADVKTIKYTGQPLFTSLAINNREILPGKAYNGRPILQKALSHTRKVTLKHDENFLTIRFSGLNFDMPAHTYYKYRLKGLNDRWTVISPQDGIGNISYTDLRPGFYELEIYSAGFDNRWSRRPVSLQIEVEAPLWATWWAKAVYLSVFIALISFGIRWKMAQSRRRLEDEKRKELEDMKYRFFTNISHEFRTLLTLIITPIGSLLGRTTDEETRTRLNDVGRNAGELLQLVNQLLDFRKMEMNGERLHLMSGNLDEFVRYVAMKFSTLAEQKAVRLEFEDTTGGLFMYFDRDKVGKILSNLLSNAFKFTKAGGVVKVELGKCLIDSHRYARIVVADTGCGISKEDQQHVFDRFFRSENQDTMQVGAGIGLNMVQEYVRLHQGRISLESETGKGSRFIVELPTDLKNERTPDNAGAILPAPKGEAGVLAKKTVLVVEDNDDFRHFLTGELSHLYHKVLTAEDGVKGALVAEEENPDIVVSDVMMPRMSGTDMCRRLKENIKTSHIPVILLTAWSTDEGRTEGYHSGADAYIAKPFDMEVLLARIDNLLEKQEKRIRNFSHNLSLDPKAVTDSAHDEKFLQEVIACIEKNIDNTEYTIDSLAHDVVMSRMSLYRKMKALTGQTPADFIRTVRLKSAARLLKTGRYNVSEACYMTGFFSPQNFAKHFKDMFGVLPSQYG